MNRLERNAYVTRIALCLLVVAAWGCSNPSRPAATVETKPASNVYFDVMELLVDYMPVGAPQVQNLPATNLTAAGAQLRGTLLAGGPDPDRKSTRLNSSHRT